MFYKNVNGEYIVSLSTGIGQIAITEKEYNELLFVIKSAPIPPAGYVYKLRADNLEWSLVKEMEDKI